ncbi:hypothetical protein EIN_052780 [Entamoeba invadens IP1]|uniref:hypothetical protein n=1 Tax=Entamoeba invadens IP1 TaxID=370355 RepID=UPI0002C3F3FA|nr:hypothetical protein EIN_052780 [Entamoeba invadens IP1]ELP93063.1 hypothetical protein EIN_052780 [Entamoeba invadens IP1]|eukprot:XP_004259834.1 hypothetical protein EIN_052780 [Entamoeba invadens IP1]
MHYLPLRHVTPNLEDNDPIPRRAQTMQTAQSELGIIYITLLSSFSTVIIGKPRHLATKTLQFMRVKEIVFEKDTLNILDYVAMRKKDKINYLLKTGLSQKTANRRFSFEKRQEIMHYLEDVLFLYHFDTKLEIDEADGIEGKLSIHKNNKLIVDDQTIKLQSTKAREYILNKLGNKGEVSLDSNLYHTVFGK